MRPHTDGNGNAMSLLHHPPSAHPSLLDGDQAYPILDYYQSQLLHNLDKINDILSEVEGGALAFWRRSAEIVGHARAIADLAMVHGNEGIEAISAKLAKIIEDRRRQRRRSPQSLIAKTEKAVEAMRQIVLSMDASPGSASASQVTTSEPPRTEEDATPWMESAEPPVAEMSLGAVLSFDIRESDILHQLADEEVEDGVEALIDATTGSPSPDFLDRGIRIRIDPKETESVLDGMKERARDDVWGAESNDAVTRLRDALILMKQIELDHGEHWPVLLLDTLVALVDTLPQMPGTRLLVLQFVEDALKFLPADGNGAARRKSYAHSRWRRRVLVILHRIRSTQGTPPKHHDLMLKQLSKIEGRWNVA